MRVNIVCKHNQARSVIAAAAIRKLFPALEVYSSGIEAVTGAPIPQQIQEIASRWGLKEIDLFSKNFDYSYEISNEDLILCADTEIYRRLDNKDIPGRIENVVNFALDKYLVPIDPFNQESRVLEIELSKMVIATTRALLNCLELSDQSRIIAKIFDRGNVATQGNFVNAWFKNSAGLIVDMNWRVPEPNIWKNLNIETYEIDLLRDLKFSGLHNFKGIICSKYEIDNPIEILTSHDWYEFLAKIEIPVLIVSTWVEWMTEASAEKIFSLNFADQLI